jgi:hypothetical protein
VLCAAVLCVQPMEIVMYQRLLLSDVLNMAKISEYKQSDVLNMFYSYSLSS